MKSEGRRPGLRFWGAAWLQLTVGPVSSNLGEGKGICFRHALLPLEHLHKPIPTLFSHPNHWRDFLHLHPDLSMLRRREVPWEDPWTSSKGLYPAVWAPACLTLYLQRVSSFLCLCETGSWSRALLLGLNPYISLSFLFFFFFCIFELHVKSCLGKKDFTTKCV